MGIDVERLKPNTQVRFLGRADVVTLVAVSPGPFYEFVYRGPSGLGELTLSE